MNYAISTQFHWTRIRENAALGLAQGYSQQAVADTIGVCRKTICNWLCLPQFAAEVDRLTLMVGVASRAERLRIATRAVRQSVRADGTIETDRDVLDWLKFAQSETPDVQMSLAENKVMNEEMDRLFEELVEQRIQERQLLLKD